jgi:uncharacterized protein (UPF0335 family)
MSADASETPGVGHNSAGPPTLIMDYVDKIENGLEEAQAYLDDVKAMYAGAKQRGLDPKILRKVIRLRKMDKAKREEEEALTEMYLDACGML